MARTVKVRPPSDGAGVGLVGTLASSRAWASSDEIRAEFVCWRAWSEAKMLQHAVSRILFPPSPADAGYGETTIIPLASPLLTRSSSLPGDFRLRFQPRRNAP